MVCIPVKVCAASVLAIVADVEGNVIVVESVPARVMVLFETSVFPLATVRTPVVVVIVKPLIEVAVATPKVGVMNVGDVLIATFPVPVVAYSPTTPLLSISTLKLVPPDMVVVPIVMLELPEGVPHVPSPRQNVVDEAPVPLLR